MLLCLLCGGFMLSQISRDELLNGSEAFMDLRAFPHRRLDLSPGLQG